jgi:hypothetical protein
MATTNKNTSYQVRPDKHTSEAIDQLNPEDGVIVFDNTLRENKYHNGTQWVSMGGGNTSVRTQGFIDYNDTTGSINLTANTWTTIPNNGAGGSSNDTYKPEGVTEFMDVSTGAIDVTELELGDTIIIRNDYKVNPNTNNALLEFRYSLGGGGNEYVLETIKGRLDNGSGKDYRFNLGTDLIYMGDTNTRDNPIFLQVRLSTNGTLLNAGSVIQLIRSIA